MTDTSIFNLTDNDDGSQTLTVTNVDIAFNNFDPSTGASSMTITAAGGFSTLPGVVQGAPGLPPVFDSITMSQVAHGTSLPDPNPVVTLVDPGGAGTAAHYTLVFYVNEGADGSTGSFLLSAAEDVESLASGLIGQVLQVIGVSPSVTVAPVAIAGGVFWPSTVSDTTTSSGAGRTLATIPIDEFAFTSWVEVSGQCQISGGDGTAQVNLVARLGSTTGPIIAQGIGVAGSAVPIVLSSGPPAGSAAGYGTLAANTTSTVYIRAEQVAGTTGSYVTSHLTTIGLAAKVQRIG